MTQEAFKRVAEKLRRAGASLPAPEVTGTIEGSVVTGLCIALALVESELDALADPMREVQRLGQEIEQEPVATLEDLEQEIYQNTRNFISRDVMEWMLRRYYTTPPQRTWVGLTEQDLDYLCNLAYTGDEEFALAVQAKLMEKNA